MCDATGSAGVERAGVSRCAYWRCVCVWCLYILMSVFMRGVGGAGAGAGVAGAAGLASWRRKRRADTLGHCMIHLRRMEDGGGVSGWAVASVQRRTGAT